MQDARALFDVILDQDEVIQKVFKPNIAKLFASNLLITLFIWIWFVPFLVLPIAFDEDVASVAIAFIILFAVFSLITFALVVVFTSVYYSNRWYAYSNKRIIIRSGIFGVDFKSLDMATIGAANVYVSPLDKLMGKNTGTIIFGSMASPILAYSSQGTTNPYKFSHITDPYSLYKEVKSVIDDYKKANK